MNNLAFSYVRFSSEKQKSGDSTRRQVRAAEAYAAEHDLVLDTKSYRDLGVSAFKGKNASTGALGTFIKAVKGGVIPKGSTLLVESLDRLSRADVDEAMAQFLTITSLGITIVTLADQQVYSTGTIKSGKGSSLFLSLAIMIRANDESAIKSTRAKAAIAKKAARAIAGEDVKLSHKCPGWMEWVAGETKPRLIKSRVALVKRIFAMSIEGKGAPTIAKILNGEKKDGKGGMKPFLTAPDWTNGVVSAILNNPAAYGTLRRKDPTAPSIPNYYPAAIDEATFLRAKTAIASRHKKGSRRNTSVPNLFSGMSYCECGSKVRTQTSPGDNGYLVCLNRINASTDCPSPRHPIVSVENAVLHRLLVAQGRDMRAVTEVVPHDPRDELRARIDEDKVRLERLAEALETAPNVKLIAEKMGLLQTKIDKANRELQKMVVQEPVSRREVSEAWDLFHELTEMVLPKEQALELRAQAQTAIRRFISKVELLFDGETIRVTFISRKDGAPVVREIKYEKPRLGSPAGDTRLRDSERAKRAKAGVVYTPAQLDWQAKRHQQKKARAAKSV